MSTDLIPLENSNTIQPNILPPETKGSQKGSFEGGIVENNPQAAREHSEFRKSLSHSSSFRSVADFASQSFHPVTPPSLQLPTMEEYYPSYEEAEYVPEAAQALLEKIRQGDQLHQQIAIEFHADPHSPKLPKLLESVEDYHEALKSMKQITSDLTEQVKSDIKIDHQMTSQAAQEICLKLIDTNISSRSPSLSSKEKRKLKNIISYIKQSDLEGPNKLTYLKKAIQNILRVDSQKTPFHKQLLNLFLFSEEVKQLPIPHTENQNEYTLFVKEEFQDPYLQGNQLNYSAQPASLLGHSINGLRITHLPKQGFFEAGDVLCDELALKTTDTVLAYLIEPSFSEHSLHEQFAADIGRAEIILQASTSANATQIQLREDATQNLSKEEALNTFQNFIGNKHSLLAAAISRVMNQTLFADPEIIITQNPFTRNAADSSYSSKGIFYFQLFPKSGNRQEVVSCKLTKEREGSFLLEGSYYRHSEFPSSEEEKIDSIHKLNYNLTYRFSESLDYLPSQKINRENMPCKIECLGCKIDYSIESLY